MRDNSPVKRPWRLTPPSINASLMMLVILWRRRRFSRARESSRLRHPSLASRGSTRSTDACCNYSRARGELPSLPFFEGNKFHAGGNRFPGAVFRLLTRREQIHKFARLYSRGWPVRISTLLVQRSVGNEIVERVRWRRFFSYLDERKFWKMFYVLTFINILQSKIVKTVHSALTTCAGNWLRTITSDQIQYKITRRFLFELVGIIIEKW